MTDEQDLEQIIDRLRQQLQSSHIPSTAADLETLVAQGFVHRVLAFEKAIEQYPVDTLPDYLRGPARWEPAGVPVEAPAQAGKGTESLEYTPPIADSLVDIARAVQTRNISPVELAERSLQMIADDDPGLHAFQLVLDGEARAAARRAEQDLQAGMYRGLLHGIPIAVKDLLAMRGTVTTAGSKLFARRVTDFDATVVERLQAAMAVIVGKTRMSELAYWPGSANHHYGATHNPHNPAHDTGGSSSGSAAAVAAGMVYGALGTDTGGSIRMPAALCGIVGLKPTFGLVSLYGAVSLSWSLDHVGPMARTVADTAAILEALVGHDARDGRTRRGPTIAYGESVLRSDPAVSMRGQRVGVLRDDGTSGDLATQEGLAAWHTGLGALEENGAVLIELDLPELELLRLINGTILVLEAAAYHQPMLRERLDDFGPIPRSRLLAAYAFSPVALVQAQQARARIRSTMDRIFERVDLLSTPSMPGPAPALGQAASVAFTAPFNTLGWPALSVPAGTTVDGLPLGLQLVGRPWDDLGVLLGARVVEAGLSGR
jgi:aspartyl-tRNA(Asn)/glutamyl-tRNA(Gln) amidotransferase subunit A